MKKFILPLLLLLAIGMLAAVESDPSAVVGYFKKTANSDTWTSFVMPFSAASLDVAVVLGDQFADQDVLQDINDGYVSTYYDGFGWFGDITEVAYGTAYYINRASANPNATYYLMGTVDPQPISKTILGGGAWTAFGTNDAAPIELTEDLFGTNEVDGDVIQDIDQGYVSTYYDGFGWFGDVTHLDPSTAYYYGSSADSPGFTWSTGLTKSSVPYNVKKQIKGK